MTLDETISLFSSFSPKRKSYFIAIVSHDLTAYARDTYVAGSEDVAEPKKLRFYNEIQHKLAGKLSATILNDDKCYSDDVFIKILFEIAEYAGICDELKCSLERAFRLSETHFTELESVEGETGKK